MRPLGTVVSLDNGNRYTVLLRNGRPTRVSVWSPGACNRAGHWRTIDAYGRTGRAAVAAAIEEEKAQ